MKQQIGKAKGLSLECILRWDGALLSLTAEDRSLQTMRTRSF